MDERSEYEEIIKENLDYDILCQDPKFDKDRFREIMDIMLDAICSTAPTIRINGENMPQQVVKSRFLKLNSSHIEYVLEAMNKNPSDIRNIRAYLLTALYNASLTIDNYYSAPSQSPARTCPVPFSAPRQGQRSRRPTIIAFMKTLFNEYHREQCSERRTV